MSDEIRVGDRFLIEVEVVEPCKGTNGRTFKCRLAVDGDWWISAPTLLSGKRLPRQIKVGDAVRVPRRADSASIYRVIAIDAHLAWLKLVVGGGHNHERLDELEVVQ